MKRFMLFLVVALFGAGGAHAETLQEAMVRAYRFNPGLEAQRAGQRVVDEQLDQAESGFRPSINGLMSIGKLYTHTPSNAMLPDHGAHTPRFVGIEVVQPLFRGFRTVGAIDVAEKQILAARSGLVAWEQNLFLNVGKAYLDVLKDYTLFDLHQHNLKVLSLRLEETQKRFSVGEATQTDVLQSKARLEGAKTELTRIKGLLQSDVAAYGRWVGEEPVRLVFPKFELALPKRLEAVVAYAALHNPVVVAASYGAQAATRSVDVSHGALLPSVDLVGAASRGWDQSDFITGRQDSAQVMVRMTIPLYNAGVTYSQTRAAKETAAQRRKELSDVQNAVKQEAITVWNALKTAQAAMVSGQAQVDADKKALEGVKKEASIGERTTLDILNAEQEYLVARINLVRATHDEALAKLQVWAVMGTLTVDALGLPVGAKKLRRVEFEGSEN